MGRLNPARMLRLPSIAGAFQSTPFAGFVTGERAGLPERYAEHSDRAKAAEGVIRDGRSRRTGATSGLYLRVLLLGLVLAPFQGLGQDGELPEEISVMGDRSPGNLERRMHEAEDRFLALFNQLVEDEFQVHCRYEAVLGSRVRQRICQSGRQKRELTRAALFNVMDMPYDALPGLATADRRFREKVQEMIAANPALEDAASTLQESVEAYRRAYFSREE